MRIVLAAAIVALLAGPAYSQSLNLAAPDKPSLTEEEKQKLEAADRAFRNAQGKIPDRKAVVDPWGNVRGADQTKNTPTKSR